MHIIRLTNVSFLLSVLLIFLDYRPQRYSEIKPELNSHSYIASSSTNDCREKIYTSYYQRVSYKQRQQYHNVIII